MNRQLKGKIALITGSSSGIGWGIAQSLAAQGCDVIIHGVEALELLENKAKELTEKFQVKTWPYRSDLSRADEIETFFAELEIKKILPDILVNNAGVQHVAPIEEFQLAKWQLLLSLHLTAPFLLTQKLLPAMKQKKWGRIINIASVHGLVASAQKSAYVAAKHGLIGLTKTIALETAKSGVTCNAVCPGWVKTPLVEAQIDEKARQQGLSFEQATEKLLGEKQPSEKFVEVSQLGDLVVFLSSESASGMTGSILTMDGGWTAQ